jgi:hypothetical protein
MIAAGETKFTFAKLADTVVERLVKRRFAPMKGTASPEAEAAAA